MRASPAKVSNHRSRFAVAVLGTFVASIATESRAYQGIRIQLGPGNVLFSDAQPRIELTAPKVAIVSGATAARLEQVRTLVADGNWDDVIDTLRELIGQESNRVVALDENRFVSLRTWCHVQIARLPAEALARYRRRVDPLAERWYRDGLAARDEAGLRRVVDELFCSSWGDDALFALGELALERADYADARRNWEQISPLLRDPSGRPAWLALYDIDVPAHWPEIEHRWTERSQSPDWLAYPDTNLNLADVRARLALVSIREGNFDRARLELEVLRRMHPGAVGRLAGQEGRYNVSLGRLLAAARDWPAVAQADDWPTFAGGASRAGIAAALGPIAGPAWEGPIQLVQEKRELFGAAFGDGNARLEPRQAQRVPACFPIVANGLVYYANEDQVLAAELASGRPAVTPGGNIYGPFVASAKEKRKTASAASLDGVPRSTLTLADHVLFARIGTPETYSINPDRAAPTARLVGLDVAREGLLQFSAQPDDERWSFDGVPVSDGRRVYVAMTRSDVNPHFHVACFDAASGRRLWRTPIVSADTPASGRGDGITHNLLTLVGNRIYINTNLGLVAALDAHDGSIAWLHHYQRRTEPVTISTDGGPAHFGRGPSPVMFHDGLLLAAPSDTPRVFALDADTGRQIWSTDRLADALDLLGVAEGNLIASGHRLWGVDVRSGRVRFVWPESDTAGIRGMGRGVVAGREVFWPTRNEIYVLDATTGAQTRRPIDLALVGEDGANLIAAEGYLIAAGYDRMMAFGLPRVQGSGSRSQTLDHTEF